VSLFVGATMLEPLYSRGVAAASSPNSSCDLQPSRVGDIGGIQWGARVGNAAACAGRSAPGPINLTPPSPPFRGSPPLTFHGGVVTGTTTPGELTVTPVYWVPTGGPYGIPTGYKTLINQFIADAAAASGKNTNVFATVQQYTNAGSTNLKYLLHTGTPITDTNAFPANGCTPDAGAIYSDSTAYSKCITNSQLLSEASAFTTAHGLPNSDLAHLYVFFLPKGVETCFSSTNGAGGGTCSINYSRPGFCGYHAFAAPPLVADMNFAVVDSPSGWTCSSDAGSNTGGNQTPNGSIDADSEISITSHEINETITDPKGTAWYEGAHNEIGDDCAYIFGDSNSFQGPAGARYNQTINTHHYFIQTELSNQDFQANSSVSCIQGEDYVVIAPTTGAPGAAVTASGGGYLVGESVKVKYKTGLTSPPAVVLCTATAVADGSFSCSGHIPSGAGAGPAGAHKIVAKGGTSLRKASTTFTRS
jgi:Phosphate-induced protein 1 conserved region